MGLRRTEVGKFLGVTILVGLPRTEGFFWNARLSSLEMGQTPENQDELSHPHPLQPSPFHGL